MGTARRRHAAEVFVREVQRALPGRLRAAWLFGSVARAADSADSDVDVLVVLDRRDTPTVRRLYGLATEISMEHDVDLSLRILSDAEYAESRGTGFLRALETEGVALA